jgi:hypothetical protein
MKLSYVIALASLFIVSFGQFIWAAIFWNSNLFEGHWIVGLLGWGIGVIDAPFLAWDIVKELNK